MGRSTLYYRKNKSARRKKAKLDKKINSRPGQLKKRRELSKKNYDHDKKYGKSSRDGMDLSHTSRGTTYKPLSENRGSKSDMPGDRRARG